MRFPWMTTRRWMVVVAAIALVLATKQCLERRAKFLFEAECHSRAAFCLDIHGRWFKETAPCYFRKECFESDGTVKPFYADLFMRQSKHYAALARKYRYVAAHPWLGIEADPPKPE